MLVAYEADRRPSVLHWDAGSGGRVGWKRRPPHDDVAGELQVVDHHLCERMIDHLRRHRGALC